MLTALGACKDGTYSLELSRPCGQPELGYRVLKVAVGIRVGGSRWSWLHTLRLRIM